MVQEQYKILIQPIRQQLYFVALKLLADEQDAEDAVQEALLKLWAARTSFLVHENPNAFAITVLKNQCLDKLRLRKNVESIENQTMCVENENPHLLLERKNENEIIRRIINRLPQLQQLIITMKDVEEYEVDEIAEIIGTSTEAVRMNLSRARKKVREEFLKILKK